MGESSNITETISEFYYACRNNDIATVRRLLDEYSLEDLDKMEPNGSTALHAACYYKNIDIVKLLLDAGFTRRVINKYKYMPFQESDSEEVHRLFVRPKTSNRFGGDISYEQEKRLWFIIDGNEQNVIYNRLPDIYNGNRLEYGTFHGDKILQQLDNYNMSKVGVIRRLFHRAINEKDCTRLVQAYTTDTDFFNIVNDYLVTKIEQNENNSNNPRYVLSEFIDTIYCNHQLHQRYSFTGKCYRSMKIKSANDLNLYKIGAKLINRSFISTTKDRTFAEKYVSDRNAEKKYAAIVSFEIRYFNTALDIENISEFPHEKEVLMMNDKIFKVINITMKNNFDVEIELRESKSAKVDPKAKQSTFLGFLHWN
ncbi:unnamed protein product [Rotaria socialis]|uniref:NAD(P)(+)--arginine ADP-ribosyltransferase n=1 Tax=Rotaria socialis TaxID=392032 RepID=A0A817UAP4_9BILA|nr:unnamed protein product [Rotaria socialis]CAF4447783.1 unnamed protein product [Rotaria socialis]